LWVILIVVVLSFVFWGASSGNILPAMSPRKVVGVIGGKDVSSDQLASAIRGAEIELQLNNVPRELLNQTKELEMEGWRRLIQLRAAQQNGVTVSDEELERFVQNVFFRGGAFDEMAYRQLIMRMAGRMSPREFDEHLRDTLAIIKLRQSLASTMLVTDDEVRQSYEADRTLMKLAYVPFYYSNYMAGIEVTTNEIEEFYNTNQDDFKVPPQVDMLIAMARIQPRGVTVAVEDIEMYYEENKDRYLLTNGMAAAGTNDTAESDEPRYRPFAEVQAEIAEQLRHQQANEVAYDLAEQLSFAFVATNIAAAEDEVTYFKNTAAQLGMTVREPGNLSLEDDIAGLSNAYGLIKTALGMRAGELSDVIEEPGVGHLLFMVRDVRDQYLPELDEISATVRDEIVRRRALDAARFSAEQLRTAIEQAGTSFTNAVAQRGYRARVTLPLDRSSGVAAVGLPAELVGRLFAFPKNASVVAPFVGGYLLACPIDYIEADFELLYNEADERRAQLERQQENMLYGLWFNQAARNVKISESLMQEPAPADVE
jgi:peptidyl-prolyl cis-trans isomerase D